MRRTSTIVPAAGDGLHGRKSSARTRRLRRSAPPTPATRAYYSGGYAPGLTSLGNPNLKPEKSTGYTLGTVFQPKPEPHVHGRFLHTKIKDLIVPPS